MQLGSGRLRPRHLQRSLFTSAVQENPFDLISTDVVMPGMSGIDLARQLRVRSPSVPAPPTTGYSEQIIGEGIHEFDVLAKLYGAEALSLHLRKILSVA